MGEIAYDRSMNQDRDAQEQAAYKAQEIVRELRTAIARGGFDNNNIKSLVSKWTEVGMYAKGSGYWNNTKLAWTMTHEPGHFATKTSQELLTRMVRLENALSKHADIKERFFAFSEAQDVMLSFVYEYRSRLKQRGVSELKQFDGQLLAYIGSLDPDLYRRLGD
jgi:hypothetical protein